MLYRDEVARLLTLAPAILGRGPAADAKPKPVEVKPAPAKVN
jgi:hypothetical protein